MKQALYRKYRPAVFDEILGQNHIVRILKNQIASDAVSHAYLFCGTRGTGKTTVARILAKGINCTSEDGEKPCGKCENCRAITKGTFFDVIEIDAASNNGVDSIRELRESVVYPPTVGKRKIYIIDEVHMLSNQAFNALLKTLEEPPEHVVFILATTEPQKLPATILSRCMKLDFRRVPETEILKGMREICEQEGIEADDGALKVLSANADGSVRDGLSLLDQCLAAGQKKLSREDVLEYLGTSGEEVFIELTDHVRFGETSEAIRLIDKVLADGKEVRQFMKDWLAHYRNLMIARFVKKPEEMLGMSCENVEKIHAQGELMELAEINTAVLQLSESIDMAKWSSQPRVLLELCAIKLSAPKMQEDDLDEKIKQIARRNRAALAIKIEEELAAVQETEDEKMSRRSAMSEIEKPSENTAASGKDNTDARLVVSGENNTDAHPVASGKNNTDARLVASEFDSRAAFDALQEEQAELDMMEIQDAFSWEASGTSKKETVRVTEGISKGSNDSRDPVDSNGIVDTANSSDTSDLNEPVDIDDPAKSSDQADSSESAKSSDQAKSSDSAKSWDIANPSGSADAADSGDTANPSGSADIADPGDGLDRLLALAKKDLAENGKQRQDSKVKSKVSAASETDKDIHEKSTARGGKTQASIIAVADTCYDQSGEYSCSSGKTQALTTAADTANAGSFDLDKIWDKVTEMAIEHIGSANLFARSAKLQSVSGNGIVIEANNGTIKGLIDKEKDLLKKLIAQETGISSGITCVVKNEKKNMKQGMNADEIAAEASKLLNVDVEIKDI